MEVMAPLTLLTSFLSNFYSGQNCTVFSLITLNFLAILNLPNLNEIFNYNCFLLQQWFPSKKLPSKNPLHQKNMILWCNHFFFFMMHLQEYMVKPKILSRAGFQKMCAILRICFFITQVYTFYRYSH